MLSRRAFLRGASVAAAGLFPPVACRGGRADRTTDTPGRTSLAGSSTKTSDALPSGLIGFAFGAAQQDVTLFDPATRQALETRPLGAAIIWLSNEQRFWDGSSIWTYDLTDGMVEALAIDPRAVSVTRRIPTGGRGPAHSLVLTPDRTTAWVNVAGENYIAAIDLAAGEVSARIETGKFP